jgi:pimeloyl-ACP methyl ester carboxylesterase
MKGVGRRRFLAAAGLGLGLLFDSKSSRVNADDGNSGSLPKRTASGSARGEANAQAEVVLRRGYTECRFGQLHYIRAVPAKSTPTKPPLVLLHQNPSSSVEYQALLHAMGTDREVVAFDTPGNGMSDWPPEPLDMAGYAAAFADGIEAMSLAARKPVDVFGYHTGTFLGAELAIAQPQQVGRLVISGIPFRPLEERQKKLDEISAGPKLTEDGEEVLDMLQRLWNFVVTNRDPRVPLRRAAQLFVEKGKTLDLYWWPYDGVWTYEVKERFPMISQPVLVLQPHEKLLENARMAAQFIPDVRIVELPELERDVFDVGAPLIASKLREFLS